MKNPENKEKSKIEFGKKIRQLRKTKGLTQEQLAEKIGIDNKHLSRIETGVHYPTYRIIKKLAIALNFDISTVEEIPFKDIETPDKIYLKSIQILNSAKTKEEKLYYLKALTVAKLELKLGAASIKH